jgi:hypothetical protein
MPSEACRQKIVRLARAEINSSGVDLSKRSHQNEQEIPGAEKRSGPQFADPAMS